MVSPSDALTLRPGRPEDWEAVWRWRRDPVTRAMSRRTHELPPETVRAEVQAAVTDPDRRLLIAELAGEPFAVVGFEHTSDGRWEVHLNLAPEARGRGLSRAVLEMAIASAFPGGAPALTAEIKSENAASRRLFEGLGFRLEGEADGAGLYGRGAVT